jgi:hypothetical protein
MDNVQNCDSYAVFMIAISFLLCHNTVYKYFTVKFRQIIIQDTYFGRSMSFRDLPLSLQDRSSLQLQLMCLPVGRRVAKGLRRYAASRKVTGSSLDGVIDFFQFTNPSCRTH